MSTAQLLQTSRSEVRKFCGKSDNEILGDIDILKKWLQTQPHLPEIPNDHMIEVFLFANKFSIEKTKERLDMYYTMRGLIPEFYKHPNSPGVQANFDVMYLIPLPKLTKDLNRVTFTKFKDRDPNDLVINNFFAHQLDILEVRIQEDLALGEVYIYDYSNFKKEHILKYTPLDIKKGTIVLEKVFSSRLKELHMINAPSYIDVVVALGKSIMKPKLANRMHLHKNIESLYEYVPKELLPRDYGGDQLSLDELNELWSVKLRESHERFDKLSQMRVNEELRPAPLTNSEILGYHGNFKKLDVD